MTNNNEIFVFGANEIGVHGAGAALHARIHHGAVYGEIFHTGMAYGIPTKDKLIDTLPLDRIKEYVDQFLVYATDHPELIFNLTPIGCGLAGYRPDQIAPFFRDAPDNVRMPKEFQEVLGGW